MHLYDFDIISFFLDGKRVRKRQRNGLCRKLSILSTLTDKNKEEVRRLANIDYWAIIDVQTKRL